jgi:hypothetical protein
MRRITQFDEDNLDPVASALEAAAQSVAKKFGLEIKSWGCSYDSAQSTFRLRATIPGAVEKKATDEYKQYAKTYGLPASGIGRAFTDGNHTFTITGLDIGRKYPVQATREDGRSYGFDPSYVTERLKAS